MYCARCKRQIHSVSWINGRPYGPTCAGYMPGGIPSVAGKTSGGGAKKLSGGGRIKVIAQSNKRVEDPDQMGLFDGGDE